MKTQHIFNGFLLFTKGLWGKINHILIYNFFWFNLNTLPPFLPLLTWSEFRLYFHLLLV